MAIAERAARQNLTAEQAINVIRSGIDNGAIANDRYFRAIGSQEIINLTLNELVSTLRAERIGRQNAGQSMDYNPGFNAQTRVDASNIQYGRGDAMHHVEGNALGVFSGFNPDPNININNWTINYTDFYRIQ